MRHQFLPYPEGHTAAPASAQARPPAAPPRVGRFAETPGVPAVRRAYRVLCRLAPGMAAPHHNDIERRIFHGRRYKSSCG